MCKSAEYRSGVWTALATGSNETSRPAKRRGKELVGVAIRRLLVPVHGLVRGLFRARRRRQAILQLRALDARLLADLGLERAAIPEYVDRLLQSQQCTTAMRAGTNDAPRGLFAERPTPEVTELGARRQGRLKRRETPSDACCAGGGRR